MNNQKKNKKKQRSRRFKIHPFDMIPLAIPVACIVFIAVEMVKSETKRINIESNYVETIGYVSNKHIGGGKRDIIVDYYFCTKDSNAHGRGYPAYKIAKKLEIGDKILIHYERGNPGNNMYYDTVPLNYIPHRGQ